MYRKTHLVEKYKKMKDLDRIRENIINSASWLFERYGYEKTSVDEIARRAHKAKASVYYHFNGKLSIFQAVLHREFCSLKEELEKIHERYPDDMKRQLATYLTERMQILRTAKVYSLYMNSSYIEGKNEISDVVEAARNDFDMWEYRYFVDICNEGHRLGILSEAVRPEAFGKLFIVLLKGLEIQFFHSEDYETLKSTYEAMVELIIFNSQIPESRK